MQELWYTIKEQIYEIGIKEEEKNKWKAQKIFWAK